MGPNQTDKINPNQTKSISNRLYLVWFGIFQILIGLVWFMFDLVKKPNQTKPILIYTHVFKIILYV